jgi:hypothetical protein
MPLKPSKPDSPALSPALPGEFRDRTNLLLLGVCVLMLLASSYFLLVRPNGSHVTNWLNDVMGLTDTAYRTYMGQIPSIDFNSIYGILVYFPAALGFHLGLNASAVLSFGQMVVASILLPLAAITIYRRFALLPALVLIVYLFLLIVPPTRMGGTFDNHTFGSYYNKHCYAALVIVLLHYVEPRNKRRMDTYLDAGILAVLTVFLAYSKVSFAAAAVGFIVANAVTSKWKLKTMSAALLMCVMAIGSVGLLTDYNSAYLSDITSVAQATGGLSSALRGWVGTLYAHIWPVLAAFLALIVVVLSGRASFFDFAFVVGSILVSCVLRDLTGGGLIGLPLVAAVLMTCGELARRVEAKSTVTGARVGWPVHAGSLAVFGLLILFVAEPVAANSLGLFSHYRAIRTAGTPAAPGLAGYAFPPEPDTGDGHLHNQLGHDDQAHKLLAGVRQADLRAADYWPLIAEGCQLLERVPLNGRSVINLEQTNPFSALMRMKPTSYGFPLLWAGMGFNEDRHPEPAQFFSGADYVMVPVVPYSQHQLQQMLKIFGPYLEMNYDVLETSPHWALWGLKANRTTPE